MTSNMRPGMPERGGYDDLLKDLDRRITALETSARLPLSSIGEGGMVVKDGGQIVFLDASDNVLVTLDQDGIEVAGEPVVLNGTGLFIGGIQQPALAILADDSSLNPTGIEALFTVNEITFPIPSWADDVSLMVLARAQNTISPGGNWMFQNMLINDVGGLNETTDDHVRVENVGVSINSSLVALTSTVTSPGSSILCRQRVSVTGGPLDFETRLEGIAIVRRTT